MADRDSNQFALAQDSNQVGQIQRFAVSSQLTTINDQSIVIEKIRAVAQRSELGQELCLYSYQITGFEYQRNQWQIRTFDLKSQGLLVVVFCG